MTESTEQNSHQSEVEKSVYSLSAKDGKLTVGLDLNRDGQNCFSVTLDLSEALKDLVENLRDGKHVFTKVSHEFKGSALSVGLYLDNVQEQCVSIEVNLLEAFQEGSALLGRKL